MFAIFVLVSKTVKLQVALAWSVLEAITEICRLSRQSPGDTYAFEKLED